MISRFKRKYVFEISKEKYVFKISELDAPVNMGIELVVSGIARDELSQFTEGITTSSLINM